VLERDLMLEVCRAGGAGGARCDLFVEATSTSIYAGRGDDRSVRLLFDGGIGLGRTSDARTVHVHTPDVSEAGARQLLGALGCGDSFQSPPPAAADARTEAFASAFPPSACDDVVRVAREVEREVHAVDATATVNLRVAAVVRKIAVASSDGDVVEDVQHRAFLSVEAVTRRGNRLRAARRLLGALTADGLTIDAAHGVAGRAAAETALARLDAIEAPTGELPVVLGPGGPAALLHEVCGHGLEADVAAHPGSAYHGRIGERVAVEGLTLVDDPTKPEDAPHYRYDDEGTPASSTVLIEDGVLRSYMHDRRSATGLAARPNGHARRVSYRFPALPRMSSTFVTAGADDPHEIVSSVGHGIYVRAISGGDTDMDSGRFTVRASEPYLIEGGRITAPLRGAILAGTGSQILQTIDRIGNDVEFYNHSYACNKLDQFPLTVSVGQPTIRIPTLHVWGG
jgi:TldD protein